MAPCYQPMCYSRVTRGVVPEAGDSREVLSEGQHKFNFSFQLPTSGLSTSFEGKYGSIRYWLKAEMEKPWTFNHKTKRAFTVISPININRMEYLVPVENSGEKQLCCWCCMAGPITITARTDRKGYCPGESIAITADFENGSGRTVVPHATLHQTQMFLAGGKARSRRLDFTRVTGLAVQPRRTASWDAQLLKIPAVSPSILNCCLIRVDYSVRLTLQIPGAYNLSLDLPVVIGTSPLRLPRLLVAPPGEEELETFPPPYHESSPATPLSEPPPTYAECIEGSVDIDDEEEDGAEMVGDTRFTPMFPYVHNYQPPPAYSEARLVAFLEEIKEGNYELKPEPAALPYPTFR
ncbi:ARRDC3 [Cordylochernes scorpioides]|uniref:ARRDC3 n=1 Tax=Cordylochernes scorpioides TaxID=51811 RepID=A0ABY6KUW1_9ARAC|nr:ARRDC3 [Cordylochernes scorpioides]